MGRQSGRTAVLWSAGRYHSPSQCSPGRGPDDRNGRAGGSRPGYAEGVTLLLRLAITPALIGGASVAARRWGASVGGWIVALPLTSGPVLFFLALDHGPDFAASAAVGSLAGIAGMTAFSLAYTWSGDRGGWQVALVAASGAYAAASLVLQPLLGGPVAILLILVLVGLWVSLRILPEAFRSQASIAMPWWDLPARMIAATLVVLVLTTTAPALGAHLSGLLATFPVFASVLTVFTHHHEGHVQAVQVLRGLLVGLFGTAAFFAILIVFLGGAGVLLAFAAALATALAIQGIVVRVALLAAREPA